VFEHERDDGVSSVPLLLYAVVAAGLAMGGEFGA
jgi:hypothetical protein